MVYELYPIILTFSSLIIFYLKFPEAYWPGKFDYFVNYIIFTFIFFKCSSHSIFHVILALAMLTIYQNSLNVYNERLYTPCVN